MPIILPRRRGRAVTAERVCRPPCCRPPAFRPRQLFCRRIGLCTVYPATSIPSTTKSAADKDSRQQAPLPGAAVRTGGEGVRGGAGRGGGSGYRRAVRVGQGVLANHCAGQAAATTAQRRPGRALRAENAGLVARRRVGRSAKKAKNGRCAVRASWGSSSGLATTTEPTQTAQRLLAGQRQTLPTN